MPRSARLARHRALALLAAPALLAPALAAAQPAPSTARRVPVAAGAPCPPGTTEVRPNACQAPELPAPSILDYRPRSTLVAPAHTVPKAKYPAIDFHGHPQGLLNTAEGLDRLRAVVRDALSRA